MSDERYVVVTVISTHRMRYCVPASKLRELNMDANPDMDELCEWARDEVTMENVKEFSQHWLGEQILDTFVLDEERMLALFDRDNDYLKEWSKDKKIEHVHDWKDNWKKQE